MSTTFKRDERGNYVNEEDPFSYQIGWGNYHQTEAIKGTLPESKNTPQRCAYGLYAEQLQGTAFTAPRVENQKVWFYRIRPSVVHGPYQPYHNQTDEDGNARLVNEFGQFARNATPRQFRWMPPEIDAKGTSDGKSVDFVDGLFTVCGSGSAAMKSGYAIHQYVCNSSMTNRCMLNSDGDLLIVPQQGILRIQTEHGWMQVQPTEICVIPRGIKFAINLREEGVVTRGYVAEIHHGHFIIPDLGPIGANGLANPRDFKVPVAAYVDQDEGLRFTIVHKFQGKLFTAECQHNPFDVVGWHGNYAPYKYDLKLYNAMNSVTWDHPDPSIYTVITCQSHQHGTAIMDFVIFPPRWSVAEDTFRPPYFHRNTMNEYMGLIYGTYEAKEKVGQNAKGFLPGGSSLHNCMSAHGPDAEAVKKWEEIDLQPIRVADGALAFMFETAHIMNMTDYAMKRLVSDEDYWKCWQTITKRFQPPK